MESSVQIFEHGRALVVRPEGSLLLLSSSSTSRPYGMFLKTSLVCPVSPLFSAVPKEPDKRSKKASHSFVGPKGPRGIVHHTD